MDKLAQEAYNAFVDGVGGKDNQGKMLLNWDDLHESQKAGWRNSVHATCEFVLQHPKQVKVEVDAYIPTRVIF